MAKEGVPRAGPPRDRGEGGECWMRKPYKRPELEVFGTVAELTLNACDVPGADGKSCRNLDEIGRSTPGSDNAGFPK